jgi:hypothetical protein
MCTPVMGCFQGLPVVHHAPEPTGTFNVQRSTFNVQRSTINLTTINRFMANPASGRRDAAHAPRSRKQALTPASPV